MSVLVVAYDDSAGAEAALARAITLARGTGAELLLAYGVNVQRAGGEVADHAAAIRDVGERALEHGRARAEADGVQVRTALVDGRVAEGLAELAEAESAEMIVVGSRGEGPLRGLLLGSTPYRLLHLAQTPVLVVPG